jgi:hypothetical protein
MTKSTPILLSVVVLLISSLACGIPNITVSVPPTADQNFWNTAVAETVQAAVVQTQILPSSMPIIEAADTQIFTVTPEPPTFSPTVTVTPSPVFTSTPLVPQVSVSVATNCREGPGKVYDRVGALLVGQVTEIYGRNVNGDYWYVRNPNVNGGFCWLWGEYATVSGNFAALPIFTPPPTPTPMPAFEPSYVGKDSCNGWWVDFEVENTGGIQFKSYSLTLRDTVTGAVLSAYEDGFTDRTGCLESTTRTNLNPGGSRIISSPSFNYDPAGDKLRATITVCSNTGQNGTCVTEVIEFKP